MHWSLVLVVVYKFIKITLLESLNRHLKLYRTFFSCLFTYSCLEQPNIAQLEEKHTQVSLLNKQSFKKKKKRLRGSKCLK